MYVSVSVQVEIAGLPVLLKVTVHTVMIMWFKVIIKVHVVTGLAHEKNTQEADVKVATTGFSCNMHFLSSQ